MDHQICDACECVNHCRKNGCIPITPATPKTALDHFADEVEASGEAEKHAYPPMFEPSYLGEPFGYDEADMRDYVDADRAQRPHFAIPPSNDIATLRQELALAYEGLERERGIAKELAAALKYARRFLKDREHATAFVDAALSKVQQP
jgi:hypothetical protein